MPAWISLTEAEYERCRYVAGKRHLGGSAHGRFSGGSRADTDVQGAVAEWGAQKCLGVSPAITYKTKGHLWSVTLTSETEVPFVEWDFMYGGRLVDVKSVSKRHHSLIVRPDEGGPSWIYMLALVVDRRVMVRGWITGEAAKEYPDDGRLGRGDFAYRVPVSALAPVSELQRHVLVD